jgi:hypothetical protein
MLELCHDGQLFWIELSVCIGTTLNLGKVSQTSLPTRYIKWQLCYYPSIDWLRYSTNWTGNRNELTRRITILTLVPRVIMLFIEMSL